MAKTRTLKKLLPKKKTYAVVVDGHTEVWYFQMLKRNEPSLSFHIDPKIPQKKSVQEQFEKVILFAKDYTKVFWVIDLDVIIKETKETRKGNKTPLTTLEECFKKLESYDNVITIISRP